MLPLLNEAAREGESEHGAALAPVCNKRDLRHGLAARLLRSDASAVTGGPICTDSPTVYEPSVSSIAFIFAGCVAVWISLNFSTETWV